MMWYGSVVIGDSGGGAVNTVPVMFEWDLRDRSGRTAMYLV